MRDTSDSNIEPARGAGEPHYESSSGVMELEAGGRERYDEQRGRPQVNHCGPWHIYVSGSCAVTDPNLGR